MEKGGGGSDGGAQREEEYKHLCNGKKNSGGKNLFSGATSAAYME